MSSLLLVGNDGVSHTDNLSRFKTAFTRAGWRVEHSPHEHLVLETGNLLYRSPGQIDLIIEDFDWIWLLGFGARSTFLDRMQLLYEIAPSKFVNSVQAFIVYHNKAALTMTTLSQFAPEQVASADIETLLAHVQGGGEWIAKPTAGSFGRDVFELTADSSNLIQILENLTRQSFVLLQRRVDTAREQRWFLAMGKPLGAYQKTKAGLRGNIRAEATPRICNPNDLEVELVHKLASKLLKLKIRACAVDIAYPYLLDVNFVNPGWFQTMQCLTNTNVADELPRLFEPQGT